MRLYVANLPFTTTELELWDAFQQYGQVDDVYMVRDRETQKPRGFVFVTMPDDRDAMLAMEQLDRSMWNGRRIRVTQAEERRPRVSA